MAISAVFFFNGMGFATWVTRIPAVRGALGLSEGQLGAALFALAAGALLSFPLAGRACARYGARRATLVTALLYCLLLPLPVFAPSLPMLALALVLLGMANGSMDVTMNAHAVEVESFAERPIMSSLHGMWSVGGVVGATLGGLLIAQGLSHQTHLTLVAALLLAGVAVSRRFLPPGTAHGDVAGPKFALPSAAMLGLGVLIFCAFLIEGALADWSAVYFQDALHTTPAIAAVGYGVFAFAMTLMRFLGDRSAAAWGAELLLRWTNGVAAIALTAALWTQHITLTVAAFALTGVAIATVAPLVFGAAARRSTASAGQGIAAMAAMGYSGFLVGPAFIGFVAQTTSLRLALGLLAAMAAVISLLAYHLRGEPAAAP
jgi:Na+/melibiose symporter-like transporter